MSVEVSVAIVIMAVVHFCINLYIIHHSENVANGFWKYLSWVLIGWILALFHTIRMLFILEPYDS